MNEKILIIDDDTKLNDLLEEYLTRFSFSVTATTGPLNGLELIKEKSFDLIILDVMMPEMDGFEVCKEIRKEYSTPIIMLTARGEVSDRIVGLELGADDYLPKPFEPRELVARIQSVMRRMTPQVHKEIREFGNLKIDSNKRAAFVDGNDINLTTMEFEVLMLFVINAGIVLNRDQIIEKTKGLDWDAFDRSIDVLISRLRSKLSDDPKHPKYLKTVWGAGYMFIGLDNE